MMRSVMSWRRWLASLALAAVWLILSPGAARAHEGAPIEPHDLWTAWNWDPFLLLGIILSGWAYALGIRSLWERAGVGRGVARWQVACFFAGLAALFIAVISPLDPLSGVLFSAHMVQHLLLILVAAPLLVIGAPPVALAWAIPQRVRRKSVHWWHRQRVLRAIWRVLSNPLMVWVLHVAAIWIWHLPNFYQAALRSELVHGMEHLSFFFTGLLFWWVVAMLGRPGRLGYGAGVVYIFTVAMNGGVLGALITFSTQLWYPEYSSTTAAWGLTPMEDQLLAGVIMWVPANFLYLAAVLTVMWLWFQGLEQADQGRSPRTDPSPAVESETP